ncbi:MAG: serine/threonine-protein kinase [Myxococcales bacterium]|jgi:serine/threonine-protein kinase
MESIRASNNPPPLLVRLGDIVNDKYRVDRIIGQGGMGFVVAATHLMLDNLVAIKFIRPEFLADSEVVARFLREGRSAARIKNEHSAQVLDVGRLPQGAPFLVMEYLQGSDLSAALRRGPLSVRDAVVCILHACEGLAEAHALGIVHRDIKPGNLFVTRRANGSACVKVLDFGISKVVSEGTLAQTNTSCLGSLPYMAPEQLFSPKTVDMQADVWSLGITLYELLTGMTPFVAEEMTQFVIKIMSNVPVPPRTFRPDVPEGLEAVLLACLEKDRSRRVASVDELARRLSPFAGPLDDMTLASVFSTDPPLQNVDVFAATVMAEAYTQGAAAASGGSLSLPSIPAPLERQVEAAGLAKPRGRLFAVLGGALVLLGCGIAVYQCSSCRATSRSGVRLP